MGVIGDRLAGKSRGERARIKARELAKLPPEAFTHGGLRIDILEGPRVVTVQGVDVLEVRVAASRGGKPLAIDGHLRFVNPPVLIPDGMFRDETGPDGTPKRVPNFVEDARGALRAMIHEAIAGQQR